MHLLAKLPTIPPGSQNRLPSGCLWSTHYLILDYCLASPEISSMFAGEIRR
jgi:hypothetical protein